MQKMNIIVSCYVHRPLTLWGPWAPRGPRHFEVRYLTAQMELDQVFGHFWHLQPETFLAKKDLTKNILFQKSYDRKYTLRSAFFFGIEIIYIFLLLTYLQNLVFREVYHIPR